MYILALETTGKYGSAAVITEDGRTFTSGNTEVMNHLRDVISLADTSIRSAGIHKDEITHIAASVGPGSFTGIRIGVSTARAMAQVMNLPCIAVSTLEAMARLALKQVNSCENRYICVIINARRHQTYAGLWQVKANLMQPILPEKQYMIEGLLGEIQKFGGRTYFIGDGIDAYEEIIREMLPDESYEFAPENVRYQTAETVAEIANEKAAIGDVVSFEALLPNYMRKSEAEMRLEEGTLSKKIHG